MNNGEGIIISRTPHGSDGIILNILSPQGLSSGIYRGLHRKSTTVHSAETQIGTLVRFTLYPHSKNTSLPYFKELTAPASELLNGELSPFRTAQKIFICDLLRGSMRGTVDDLPMYLLLKEHLSALHDSKERYVCMRYAYHLCGALGFGVETEEDFTGKYFDMCEGVFSPQKPLHNYYLTAFNSRLFFSLGQKENITFSSAQEWEKTWHILMTYFSLHVDEFMTPRSLEYLKDICKIEFFPQG